MIKLLVNSNDFLHRLLLTNIQVSRLRKAFVNKSSANIELSRTQLHKIGKSEGFLGRPLGLLLKIVLPLMKNVLQPLAKGVSTGLTSASPGTEAVFQKKVFGSVMTILLISDEEMNDITKIIKSLKQSGLLITGVSEAVKKEAKKVKRYIYWHVIRCIRC